MKKIVIQVGHPGFENSKAHLALTQAVSQMENVTVRDLYKLYPDLNIDVKEEQKVLLDHEGLVFQFPLYWYSSPAIIKQWQDVILEWGFAQGGALQNKPFMISTTAGSSEDGYVAGGRHQFTMSEYLRPFQGTALICGMRYSPPFVLYQLGRMTDLQLKEACEDYKMRIKELQSMQ